jgi:hypothetical protein
VYIFVMSKEQIFVICVSVYSFEIVPEFFRIRYIICIKQLYYVF